MNNNEEHLNIMNLCAVLDKIQNCNKEIVVIIKSTEYYGAEEPQSSDRWSRELRNN